jgi:hypothetical protein
MWIPVTEAESTSLFDKAVLALDSASKIKVSKAIERLWKAPDSPELDLRVTSIQNHTYSVRIDDTLRMSVSNKNGKLRLRALLRYELLDGD